MEKMYISVPVTPHSKEIIKSVSVSTSILIKTDSGRIIPIDDILPKERELVYSYLSRIDS